MARVVFARARRTLVTGLLVLALGAIAAPPAHAGPRPPEAVVKAYYAKLVLVLQNAKKLGFQGRYEALEPAIRESFDMHFITAVSVGHFWKKFTEDQRNKTREAMRQLSTATYAARFTSYAGEQFQVLGKRTTSRGDVIVLTRIVKRDGEKVKINYLLRKRTTEWRIIDVHLKGTISELAKWRAEFSSILRRKKGYDGLITAIDAKIKRLSTE